MPIIIVLLFILLASFVAIGKQRRRQLINGYICLSDVFFRFVHDNVLVCFLLSCSYVLLITLTQPLMYGGDDIGFVRAIENSQDVPFMSLLLVRLLGLFYQYISSVIPWYSIFLYIVHCISITLFLRVMFSFRSFRYYVLSFVILYLLFYSYFIMQVSYNNAAIMIGGNSLFAFMASVRFRKGRGIESAIYGFLFVFSYLIRLPAIKAVLVFSLPVIIFSLFSDFKKNKIMNYIYFIIPVFIIIGLNVFTTNYLTSKKYQDYLEFNKLRGAFHGYDVQFEKKYYNDELLEKNNWSVTDADALNYWYFIDERKFNQETLANVIDIPVTNGYMKTIFMEKISLFYDRYNIIFPLYLFSLVLVIFVSPCYRAPLGSVFYFLYTVAGMFYMAIVYRFPPRIGFPLLLLCSTAIIFIAMKNDVAFASEKKRAGRSPKKGLVLLVTSMIFLSVGLSWLFERREMMFKGQHLLSATVEQLEEFSPHSFFVGQGLSVGVNYMDPLKTYESFFKGVMFVPGMYPPWTIFTPMYYNVLNQIGIDRGYKLFSLMLDNDRAYFIIWNTTFKFFLVRFAEENLHKPCHLEAVRALPKGRTVYKLVSGAENLSWEMFLPAIIRNNSFPWHNYLESLTNKTPFLWSSPVETLK